MATLRGGMGLRDPQGTGSGDLLRMLESDQALPDDDPNMRNGGLDPGRKADLPQIETYVNLRQKGTISDKAWSRLIQRNPRSATLFAFVQPSQDALQQRARAQIGQKFFRPEVPMIEQGDVIGRAGRGEDVAPIPATQDFQGAMRAALARGDVDFAKNLQGIASPKGAGFYGGVQYAIDPKTNQYVPYTIDESSGQPVRIQTPAGTEATVPIAIQPGVGPQGPGLYPIPTRQPASGTPRAVPGVTPLPTAAEAQSAGQAQNAFDMLDVLETSLTGGKISVGPVAGRILRVKAATGVGLTEAEANVLSIEQQLSNQLLQAMRGAQVGPKEQERFDKQLPRVDQPDNLFKANIRNTRRNLEGLQKRIAAQRPIRRAVPNQGAPRNVEGTKVIGGKTYIKINGKWFER